MQVDKIAEAVGLPGTAVGIEILSAYESDGQRQGFTGLDAQTMDHNAAALALYRKLGFEQVDQGVVFRKEGAGTG